MASGHHGAELKDINNKDNLEGNCVGSCLIVVVFSGRFCVYLEGELNNKRSRHKVFQNVLKATLPDITG